MLPVGITGKDAGAVTVAVKCNGLALGRGLRLEASATLLASGVAGGRITWFNVPEVAELKFCEPVRTTRMRCVPGIRVEVVKRRVAGWGRGLRSRAFGAVEEDDLTRAYGEVALDIRRERDRLAEGCRG